MEPTLNTLAYYGAYLKEPSVVMLNSVIMLSV